MIDYSDLIGLGHKEGAHDPACGALDCAGVVMAVLNRLGLPGAASSFSAALRPEDGTEHGWTPCEVDQPRAPGDVLVFDVAGGPLHVAVAIGAYRALSSATRLGVYSHAITVSAKNLVGVYRPPPEPRS